MVRYLRQKAHAQAQRTPRLRRTLAPLSHHRQLVHVALLRTRRLQSHQQNPPSTRPKKSCRRKIRGRIKTKTKIKFEAGQTDSHQISLAECSKLPHRFSAPLSSLCVSGLSFLSSSSFPSPSMPKNPSSPTWNPAPGHKKRLQKIPTSSPSTTSSPSPKPPNPPATSPVASTRSSTLPSSTRIPPPDLSAPTSPISAPSFGSPCGTSNAASTSTSSAPLSPTPHNSTSSRPVNRPSITKIKTNAPRGSPPPNPNSKNSRTSTSSCSTKPTSA